MWEELVGLKSQMSRPNLLASFGGLLREWKQGKEAESSQQRGLNVWTKPNGIFRAKECSGVHWGEPAGPGRTWPLSLLFKIVHLVVFCFFVLGWFDALGLNVFLLSATSFLFIYIKKRAGWMTISASLVFSKTSIYLFIVWWCTYDFCLLIITLKLGQFWIFVFDLRWRCEWYLAWFGHLDIPLIGML